MRTDVKLVNDDISYFDGDFDILPSATQEASLIVFASLGDWRQFPLVGVGIRKMTNAPINQILNREIRKQLDSDGLAVKSVIGDLEELQIILSNDSI